MVASLMLLAPLIPNEAEEGTVSRNSSSSPILYVNYLNCLIMKSLLIGRVKTAELSGKPKSVSSN